MSTMNLVVLLNNSSTYIDPLGNSFQITVSKSYDILVMLPKCGPSFKDLETQYNSRGQPIQLLILEEQGKL